MRRIKRYAPAAVPAAFAVYEAATRGDRWLTVAALNAALAVLMVLTLRVAYENDVLRDGDV